MCFLTFQRLEVLNMILWTKLFFNANFKNIDILNDAPQTLLEVKSL